GEVTVTFLTDAQRAWAAALRDERASIFDYNIAIADFERQKGTILQYDNVTLAEGPVPRCVQAQASKHIQDRTRALVLRQRPAPVYAGACCNEAVLNGHPPSMPAV